MATPTLRRLLGYSAELAALQAHAARLEKLQSLYASLIPAHLADASRVANYKLEVLIVHAANAPVAAKLKHLTPRLKSEFLRQGIPLSDIQIRVSPIRPKAPAWQSDRDARLSKTAQASVKTLEASLDETSPLKDALRRFIDRTRS